MQYSVVTAYQGCSTEMVNILHYPFIRFYETKYLDGSYTRNVLLLSEKHEKAGNVKKIAKQGHLLSKQESSSISLTSLFYSPGL